MQFKSANIFDYFNRYRQNGDGATAIEFSILAIPFCMMIFAILELAIIFFISSSLAHAVNEAGREIRVGNMQSCGSEANFKTLVCDNMEGFGDCQAHLRVDVVSEPTFTAVVLPPTPPPVVDPSDPTVVTVPAGSYDNPLAAAPVVIRAQYYHRLAIPPVLTRLENIPNTGIRLLESTTAFRAEPFPSTGACPV